MKKVFAFLIILLTFAAVHSATQTIDISKGQLWGRAALKLKLNSNGFGAVVMAGSRYNVSYSKHVNSVETSTQTEDAWLQEVWVGPSYSGKHGAAVKYSASILYAPQIWYVEDDLRDYTQHALQASYILTRTLKTVSLSYRAMLWYLFEVDNEHAKLDNELLSRWLVNLNIPIKGIVSAIIEDEVYLKMTADEKDLDGTEVFNKNAFSAGLRIKPSKSTMIDLKYVNIFTNKQNDNIKHVFVYDHYFMIDFVYLLDFVKK
jgi:hypothetical protein